MYVFDIEADNLLEDATKIHVLSYWKVGTDSISSTFDYNDMREFFANAGTVIGHNIVGYDLPLVRKLLGIDTSHLEVFDTLPISWYLYPERARHGLETWGETFGVPKPKIADWNNLSPEEYQHRCEEDVKINRRLWSKAYVDLKNLYGSEEDIHRFLRYLTFKMQCASDQEALKWKLDVPKAQELFEKWSQELEDKKVALAKAMPKVPVLKEYSRPKVMYKKDGSLSAHGQRWFSLLKEQRQPETTVKPVKIVVDYDDGNPGSPQQVKDWLRSLGWKPKTFKFVKDDDGNERQIEQVRKDGQLCSSVTDLIDDNPDVAILDGYTVLQHRLGIIKSFLKHERDGYLVASVGGLTNTLRFKHREPLVNLPGVTAPYGSDIRGCLTCPEGYTLCGSDMVSLEDTTKRHYMQPHDPKYVEEMCKPGFDPHLDLAKHAGAVTQEEIDQYNAGTLPSLKAVRKNYKVVNYSSTYGIGKAKLARELGITQKEAQALLDGFWSRNEAITKAVNELTVRTLGDKMWLKNPVSGFWYSLRSERDKFSTLNQGTGVYCFDTWVGYCKAAGVSIIGQFHDEIIALVPRGQEQDTQAILKDAIAKANNKLNLNINLDVDVQFGGTYAEIH